MEKQSFANVDEYIGLYPPEIAEILTKVREIIRTAAPQATEKVSWQMPTYHQKENLVHFAAQKHHLGFYPGADGVVAFAEKLKDYKTSKGAVQFPYAKPIPYDLIGEITRWRVKQVSG